MIRICAWCKQILGEVEPLENKDPTHTICIKCQPQFLVDNGMTEGEAMKEVLRKKTLDNN